MTDEPNITEEIINPESGQELPEYIYDAYKEVDSQASQKLYRSGIKPLLPEENREHKRARIKKAYTILNDNIKPLVFREKGHDPIVNLDPLSPLREVSKVLEELRAKELSPTGAQVIINAIKWQASILYPKIYTEGSFGGTTNNTAILQKIYIKESDERQIHDHINKVVSTRASKVRHIQQEAREVKASIRNAVDADIKLNVNSKAIKEDYTDSNKE